MCIPIIWKNNEYCDSQFKAKNIYLKFVSVSIYFTARLITFETCRSPREAVWESIPSLVLWFVKLNSKTECITITI